MAVPRQQRLSFSPHPRVSITHAGAVIVDPDLNLCGACSFVPFFSLRNLQQCNFDPRPVTTEICLKHFGLVTLAPQSSGLMVQHPGQRLHTLWASGSQTSRRVCAVYLKCFFSSACSCQLVSYFRSEKRVVQKPFNGPCKLDYFIFPRFSPDCFVSFFISTWRDPYVLVHARF